MRNFIILIFSVVSYCTNAQYLGEIKLKDYNRLEITTHLKKAQITASNEIQSSLIKYSGIIINRQKVIYKCFLSVNQQIKWSPESSVFISNKYELLAGPTFYLVELAPEDKFPLSFEIEAKSASNLKMFYVSEAYAFGLKSFESKSKATLNGMITHGLILILLFLTIMNIGGYLITARNEYGFYGAYTFILLFYFACRYIFFNWYFLANMEYLPFHELFNIFIQPLFYVFYSKFIQSILNTKEFYPKIHKKLNLFIKLSIAGSLSILISYYIYEPAGILLFHIYRIFAVILSISLIYDIYLTKSKTGKYVVTGTLFLVVFASMAMILSFIGQGFAGLYPISYFKLGIALEFLFFTLGMAQKTASEMEKQLYTQIALNESLKKNELIQSDINERLNTQLEAAKTDIIREQEQKARTILALKDKESELEILLSQMNPHFIFNSLNSLKKYIFKEDKSAAIEHIDQFSQLIRNFLEYSRIKNIPIKETIENLKLYIEMESKRMYKPIVFDVKLSPEIEPEYDEIPALLIQPFIENAILHGLSNPKIKNPVISLNMHTTPSHICIEIQDNGIGRQAAAKKNDEKNHLGIATKMTETRIHLINNAPEGLEIIDLYDTDGKASGTLVRIKLKRQN